MPLIERLSARGFTIVESLGFILLRSYLETSSLLLRVSSLQKLRGPSSFSKQTLSGQNLWEEAWQQESFWPKADKQVGLRSTSRQW